MMKKTVLTKQPEKRKESVQITPALAVEWLSKNGTNRRMSERVVNRYAADIMNGKWLDNGNPIKFSSTGALLDGQHRLKAIVQSGITTEMDVVFDLDPNAFHTIDIGKSRTAADILHIAGEQYPAQLGSALKLLYFYNITGGNMKQMSTNRKKKGYTIAMLEEVLKEHPGLRESISITHQCQQAKVIANSVAGVMHYIFSQYDRDLANDFFYKLAKGNDLVEGNPILALRNRLMRHEQSGRGEFDQTRKMALCIKAWNKYREGAKISNIVYDPDQDFPVVEN